MAKSELVRRCGELVRRRGWRWQMRKRGNQAFGRSIEKYGHKWQDLVRETKILLIADSGAKSLLS
jgi:hypothetical protein